MKKIIITSILGLFLCAASYAQNTSPAPTAAEERASAVNQAEQASAAAEVEVKTEKKKSCSKKSACCKSKASASNDVKEASASAEKAIAATSTSDAKKGKSCCSKDKAKGSCKGSEGKAMVTNEVKEEVKSADPAPEKQ